MSDSYQVMGKWRKWGWDISKSPNYGVSNALSEPALNATGNLWPKGNSIGSVDHVQNRINRSYLAVTLWGI
jgi:hypothetical protein